MQQTSKAGAEQKSLVVRRGSVLLSSTDCTAYQAHLPDWGCSHS